MSTTTVFRSAAVGAAALVLLAGCGGQQSAGSGTSQAPQAPASSQGGGQGSARRPGVSGLIAAVQGTTMQVQGNNAQTAVSWNDQTTFTKQVAASLADVKVGSCVNVRSGSGGQTARPTARPTAQPSAPATPVEATVVTISDPVNGSCNGGYGNATHTASPTSTASRTPRGNGTPGSYNGSYGGGAQGVVKSVSGNGFVVTEQRGSQNTDVTIDTTGATTYAKTAAAAASDVKAGECATAMGKTDDTGAVQATSVALSGATNGACRNG